VSTFKYITKEDSHVDLAAVFSRNSVRRFRTSLVAFATCCTLPISEASVADEMTAPGRGWTSAVAATRAALAAQKAAAARSDQTSVFGFPRSRSVNGWSVPAIPGRKRR
jgi:hypothetical protein